MHLPLPSPVRRTVAMTVWGVAWATLLSAVVATRQAPAPPAGGTAATPAATALQAPDAFETRIRPLLAANCYACHGEAAMGGLRLDTREGFFKGSDTGAIVEPRQARVEQPASRCCSTPPAIRRCRRAAPSCRRPTSTCWSSGCVLGASWPAPTTTATATPVASHAKVITAEQRAFWAFAPLADRHAAGGARRGLAAHRHRPLRAGPPRSRRAAPVADADKRTLLRRVTLDLTGLPPTPDEIDAFLADASPGAFETRSSIGCSPRRATARPGAACGSTSPATARTTTAASIPMGRGYNPYPNAHLYRDWVIRAFNDDLPYDQFVTAQLAADLLPSARARAAPAGARLPRPRPVVLRQRRRRDHARRRTSRPRRRGEPRPARPHRRAARAATITSTTRFRPRTTTRWAACS